MKTRSLLGLLAFTAVLPLATFAQTPPAADPSAAPSVGASGNKPHHGGRGARRREALAALAPEEQQKFRAARRATRGDQGVINARRTLQQAERDALLRADPTLGPTLDKLQAARPDRGFRSRGGGNMGGRMGRNLANLSEEERTKLRSAHRAAQSDPAVASARQEIQSATTPEARRAAARQMRKAVRSAMLRSDPSVAPIIQKMRASRRGGAEVGA